MATTGRDSPSVVDDLRTLCSDLQRQVTHSLVVEQELINARDRRDRDLNRLLAIGAYSRRAIAVQDLADFARATAETIIEAFELECGAVLVADGRGSLQVEASSGLGSRSCGGLDVGWVASRGLLQTGAAHIERVSAEAEPWRSAGLAELIACPLSDRGGALGGLLIGGVSVEKEAYYGSIDPEIIPSFVLLRDQVQSLLHNLLSRRVINEQMERLRATQSDLARANADLRRRVTELSTLHRLAMDLGSILDLPRLLDAVLRSAVRDLGYDRALIMLVDPHRRVLCGGRGFGVAAASTDFVERLEIPLEPPRGGLAGVVLTGEPLLVADASVDERLDPEIVRVLQARSFLAVPLRTADGVIGVLAVDNWRTGAPLASDDVRVVATLASEVAIAVANARLVEKAAQGERLSAIGEMATGIAHEIRNPLTSIVTLVDILGAQAPGVDPLVFRGIKEESRRLQEITTRFLSYARPYVPSRSRVDINVILEEVASLLEIDEGFSGSVIEREYDRGIGDVHVDGDGLKQVFWNLILNGLQAMPGGGRLIVRSAARPGILEIEIEDMGTGIPPQALKRIFEPFYTTKDKGTGLGLPIADKIVRAHGGSIRVLSGRRAGTTVRVVIPKKERELQ
jgi:signal transduction histidine kinase